MGNISPTVLGGKVASGGGAMLYLTFSELLPAGGGALQRVANLGRACSQSGIWPEYWWRLYDNEDSKDFWVERQEAR